MADQRRICLALITAPHGVRGQVKLRPFTAAPGDVTAYGPLTDESGTRRFAVQLKSQVKGQWLAEIDGVSSREAAEALRGTRLYVERSALPPAEDDSFYHADLIGLAVEDRDGAALGTVRAIYDFGAGDTLEVSGPNGSLMIPFTKAAVPVVDLDGGRLVVEPPRETEAMPETETSEARP